MTNIFGYEPYIIGGFNREFVFGFTLTDRDVNGLNKVDFTFWLGIFGLSVGIKKKLKTSASSDGAV